MIRTFLAFDISSELKQNLSRFISKLQIKLPDVKWVSSQNIHCTLKFFGDVEEEQIEKISELIFSELVGQQRINLECVGMGAFPSSKKPRVVWAGIAGELQKIQNLVLKLDNSFEKIGFSKEERGFSPHLTLGRIKKPISNIQDFEHILEREKTEKFGDIMVERLTLYKSVLAREGSIYKVLKEFSFAGDK